MAAICDAVIHLCKIRVTRLTSTGSPASGPNNVYVTDKPMMIQVRPQIEAGQDKTLVGGCDCIIAQYRGYDKLKYYNLELDLGVVEPALEEMLTGGAAILAGGLPANPIGVWFPSQVNCSSPVQPNVCFEAWQDLWATDHQESAPYQYVHWIFPSSYWQKGDGTLQNDFFQPKFTGFTRGNTSWGLGIFGDMPETVQPMGGYFYANTTPTAACGYQSRAIT